MLRDRILNRIRLGSDLGFQGEEGFDVLACDLFKYQFESVPAYRRLCERVGIHPDRVSRWQEIPPLPTVAFKEAHISSVSKDEAVEVFETSGTTTGDPGRHYLRSVDFYRAAIDPPFARNICSEQMAMIILTPERLEAPRSSLVFMMDHVARRWGAPGEVSFHVRGGALDLDGAQARLRDCQAQETPVLLLGTSFSYVHLMEGLRVLGERFSLPAGSRIFDTGGTKGRSRSVTREELHQGFYEYFGIQEDQIILEYGMTELSSQFYARGDRRRFRAPSWVRVQVLDPVTLESLPVGEEGVLAIFDLANVDSVASILTADRALLNERGEFLLTGRIGGSSRRGCSLASEDLGVST
ncbi:MAG: long-chain fatty acid--CoA ligase [Planctomycetota bacterium]|jgi:hypothetical protein|nr:long-chain fatty acid--CoA ligase [Planctomycetota bacterium]